MIYIPYKNFMKKRWEVNFPDRNMEFGDISYVTSEYLSDGLIYEYNCDGKRCHEHNFNSILENIVKDITCGHDVNIKGFEYEYSEQEISIINNLINKLYNDVSKYNINSIVNKIKDETIKPVFKYSLEEKDDLTIYDSKVGGKPFWKDDLEYPTANGKPLILLAQINFKDLPKNDIFPSTGMLQFFIFDDEMCGLDTQGGYQVIYHEDLDNAKDINISHKDSTYFPILKEGHMLFNFSNEGISVNDIKFWTLYVKLFDPELNDIIDDIVYDRFNSGYGNKLLGYPAFTQYDPRENSNHLYLTYNTLLFQLDSDYKFVNWGDSGIGNFFINDNSLKEIDFSDVLYNWDCC